MTAYRPCHNCSVAPDICPRRQAIRAAISGVGVTSIKFKCADRRPLFSVGQRVQVTWIVPENPNGYAYGDESTEEAWPATVIKEVGPKFLIRVDDVDSDNDTPARSFVKSDSLYAKVAAAKLKPIDQPPRTVCSLCGEIKELGLEGCWQNGTYKDAKCLRRAAAADTFNDLAKGN